MFQLARRGMFVQTQDTPNPNAMMFLPGQDVMGEVRLGSSCHGPISADVPVVWLQGGGTAVFSDIGEARSSPLAKSLFQIQGVSTVFYGADYISVTIASSDWCASEKAFVDTSLPLGTFQPCRSISRGATSCRALCVEHHGLTRACLCVSGLPRDPCEGNGRS